LLSSDGHGLQQRVVPRGPFAGCKRGGTARGCAQGGASHTPFFPLLEPHW
jgi:hypothetical protein